MTSLRQKRRNRGIRYNRGPSSSYWSRKSFARPKRNYVRPAVSNEFPSTVKIKEQMDWINPIDAELLNREWTDLFCLYSDASLLPTRFTALFQKVPWTTLDAIGDVDDHRIHNPRVRSLK